MQQAHHQDLPVSLDKDLIVDAIFEIRFDADEGCADVLPGLMLSIFPASPKVHRLPTADFPAQFRASQPDLMYEPLTRLDWDNYFILLGDRSIGLGCKLPYMGWLEFKKIIISVADFIVKNEMIKGIERYSMKYIDFLSAANFKNSSEFLNWEVKVGGESVTQFPTSVRYESRQDGYTVLFDIHSDAQMKVAGKDADSGIVISTDIIKLTPGNKKLSSIYESFNGDIENIHNLCKRKFFSCLKREAWDALGAKY